MKQVLRTNDPVALSFAEALLSEADIPYMVADQHISAVVGMVGVFARRILVHDDDEDRARRLIADAGIRQDQSSPI